MGKLIEFLGRGGARKPPADPLLGLLADEIERSAERKARELLSRRAGRHQTYCLFVALVGSMLPIAAANLFFSVAALITAAAMMASRRRLQLSRPALTGAGLLAIVSIATGCSPAFTSPREDILAFCRSISQDGACRVGTSTGYRVLGIPIRQASIEGATAEAGITDRTGVETIKGNGLISIDLIRVYGS